MRRFFIRLTACTALLTSTIFSATAATTDGASQRCALAADKVASMKSEGWSTLRITRAEPQPADQSMVAHCLIEGAANERIGKVDGRPYAIKFRMRLPHLWNEKFFMAGGGGTNGVMGDGSGPIAGYVSALARGYAVIVTDAGHDNAVNTDPAQGGAAAFGLDPQARLDMGYNAYDVVTQLGKVFTSAFYGSKPKHSYFIGCSEGGREASILSQRFPSHYDGVVAGCPAMSTPIMAAYSSHLAQVFSPLAVKEGHFDPSGKRPLLTNLYTDADFQLVSQSILKACDALDGLADGMVNNLAACTDAVVIAQLKSLACTGAKTDSCMMSEHITALVAAFSGPKTSTGTQLYPGNPWDPGIGGMNGKTFNQGFRAWWVGSYGSKTNNAIKLTLSSPLHAMFYTTPPVPLTVDQNFDFELNFNRDELMANASRTTALYTTSALDFALANSTDLSGFKQNGGKLIVWIGQADPAVSPNETISWYDKVNQAQNGTAASFARLFLIPGMNHGGGGPATDKFDMLTALENWVELGAAPDQIPASATNPGYFGVSSRTRPLCPYPQYARYKGSGDINTANNFSCK